MKNPIRHVAIVVPARDEEEALPACLESISDAVAELATSSPEVSVHCVIVAHRSSDRTEELASAHELFDAIVVDHGDVGTARAAGMLRALEIVDANSHQVWLATTDADSTVPRNWLVSQLALADEDADAVLGIVAPDLDSLDETRATAWRRWNERGHADEQVHGANLGVRASAYLAAGGFRANSVAEDVELVARLHSSGARIVESVEAPVTTSARLDSRIEGGYASWLRDRLIDASERELADADAPVAGSRQAG